ALARFPGASHGSLASPARGARHAPRLVRVGPPPLPHVQDESSGRVHVVNPGVTSETALAAGRPIVGVIRSGLALLSPRERRIAVALTVPIAVASALQVTAGPARVPVRDRVHPAP